MNEGIPIVVARPQSEPAEAFGASPPAHGRGTGRRAQVPSAAAVAVGRQASALRKEGIAMELHERISSDRRPAREQEPFAELKNRIHMSVISGSARSSSTSRSTRTSSATASRRTSAGC